MPTLTRRSPREKLCGVTTLVNDALRRLVNSVNAQGGTATYAWDVPILALPSTDEMVLKTTPVYDSLDRSPVVETVRCWMTGRRTMAARPAPACTRCSPVPLGR